jgi:beta-lactam-binding protein with PASTA domain
MRQFSTRGSHVLGGRKARKNHVLAQNPKPGKALKQGAKVDLTVGKGPKRK